MSETCRLRRGEGYGACDDEEPAKIETKRHSSRTGLACQSLSGKPAKEG